MVNKVTLIGNLGADPEVRTTQGGTVIGNLRLATTTRRKDRDGNWTDHTDWHRVTCFGNMAENVSKYQKKGNRLYVDGRISYSKYTDRDGNERWSTDIIANEIKFLDRRDANLGGGGGASDNNSDGQAAYNPGPTSGGSDDDIPF